MSTIDKLDLIANNYYNKSYIDLNRQERDFVFALYLGKYATSVLSPTRVN